MCLFNSVIFLLVVEAVISFSGTLTHATPLYGHIRERRDMNIDALLRLPRSSSGSFASASSSAGASSSSGSGPTNFNGYIPSFAAPDYDFDTSNPGVSLFSRFGEEEGTGVHATGSAQGPKSAFSSTFVSADDTGKVKYAVRSGKS